MSHYDDTDGAMDSYEWDASYRDATNESRALVANDDAWDDEYAEDDDTEDDDTEDEAHHAPPLIIPGGVGMAHPRITTKRRSSLGAQVFIFSVAACVLLSALFSVGYVSNVAGASGSPISALVNIIVNPGVKSRYTLYRARPGDTFQSIATQFNVQVTGIFELNHLVVNDYLKVGTLYEIPTDPNYGINYIIPLGSGASYGAYEQNIVDIQSPPGPGGSASFQFNAVAGVTNDGFLGKAGICPAGYAAWADSGLGAFGFINPDQPTSGKAVSRVTQRFWQGHDGMDISTGMGGTPLYAVQAGTVIFAGWDAGGGGWTIKIGHCDNVSTSYSHMVPGSFTVKLGDNVPQGKVIGMQGESGDAFGFHVHFMVFWRNVPVDALCAFPNGMDGDSIYSEPNGPYNGCPPNLGHNHFP